MSKKNIIILGGSVLALEIGRQIYESQELNLSGFIKEKNEDVLDGFTQFDLGSEIDILKELKPDLCIALDYHRIIPAGIINSFRIINSHGGILPDNRGYHTLGWGFINGYKELGYTLHLMDEGLDSGDIIYTFRYNVNKKTTFTDVKSAIDLDQKKNIVRVVGDYINGKVKTTNQKTKYPKYFTKRNLSDCMIDWNNEAVFIERFIRALSIPEGPGAFTVYNNKRLTILTSEIYQCEDYIEIPGHVVYKTNERILVKTKDKCIWIEDVIYNNVKSKAGSVVRKNGARLGLNITEEILKERKII